MTPTCPSFYNQYASLTFLSSYLLYLGGPTLKLRYAHGLAMFDLDHVLGGFHVDTASAVRRISTATQEMGDRTLKLLPVLVHFSSERPFYMEFGS